MTQPSAAPPHPFTRREFWLRALSVALGVFAGVVASLGTLAVVAAGFGLSFDALKSVALGAHINSSLAWLYPLTVDGSMAVATVVAIVLHRLKRSVVYPWSVVVVGAAISIVCNALHAQTDGGVLALPRTTAMAVSAVPPLLLAMSVHLLVLLVDAIKVNVATAASPVPRRQAVTVKSKVKEVRPASEPSKELDPVQVQDAIADVKQRNERNDSRSKRWSAEELRDAILAMQSSEPDLSRDQQARRLGVSARRIRQVLAHAGQV